MLPIMWIVCAVVIITAAARVPRHPDALRTGRLGVGVLYLGAGALVNAVYLVRGDNYAKFADGAYLPFVRDTWRSLVVPNHYFFISLLVLFELVVGILVLSGGKRTQVGLGLAIAFHVALLSFGWGFYLWSLPMLGALGVLLRGEIRAERRSTSHAAHAVAA